MRRRRLLTGLSAASVAAALPSFAFGGTARADDDELQLFTRLVRAGRGRYGRQYHLFLKASAAVTLPPTLQVRESHLTYRDGSRGELRVAVASTHTHDERAMMRRAPPRHPPVELSTTNELHIATLSLRARILRDRRGEAHIEMTLAGNSFVLPNVTLMA